MGLGSQDFDLFSIYRKLRHLPYGPTKLPSRDGTSTTIANPRVRYSYPTIDYVPSELCIEIFRGVSKSDLKSIRLVLKKLNTLSSPLLFTRVYTSLHLKDLEVLSAISRHPILSLFA